MLLSPLYFSKPGFYFRELNRNRGAHMFCSTGRPASWLPRAGALWGHIFFLQNSSQQPCIWGLGAHSEKQLFRKAAGKQTRFGLMYRTNGKHTGIHNRQSPMLSFSIDVVHDMNCCLFSDLLICDWRMECNQNYKNFHKLRCSGRLIVSEVSCCRNKN